MTTIYLIRHTQAEGNLYRMMQGHWDGDITREGAQQIELLSKRFENTDLDAVYSSDLYRAVTTAESVARTHGLPVLTREDLREIDVGDWQAEFFGNVEWALPEEARLFMYDSEKWIHETAESFEDVKVRAYRALSEIASEHEGQTVAVCSHGVTIRCLLSKINGVPLSDIKNCPICKNTAVSKLYYEDGVFRCDYLNDYSHLGSLGDYHWWATADLRDEPCTDDAYYKSCYADAWAVAHGGEMDGFDAEYYLNRSRSHVVLRLFDEERPAGLVDFIPETGWISLLYLSSEYRGKGYGIQALARPIMYCEKLGTDMIQLNVNKNNSAALEFYRRNGFTTVEDSGRLLTLQRKIRTKK